MSTALLFATRYKQENRPFVEQTIATLREGGVKILCYRTYFEQQLKEGLEIDYDDIVEEREDLKKRNIDWMFCLGGDGTILNAVTIIKDAEINVVGINLGRLGFLANLEKNRIDQAVRQLLLGKCSIEERSLLKLESKPAIFQGENIALNDFTILKRDNSSMITIHCYIEGEFLNSYWGDGLIVSTPTGSTGYSLSCGGPIITPNSETIAITPVAPHHLSVRPIVIKDNATLTFQVEGRAANYLCTLDSRFEVITSEYELAIKKNEYPIRLVNFPDITFFDTMRKKLLWGSDVRPINGRKKNK